MLATFLAMLLVGLAGSTHCVSMCGPLVVSYAVTPDSPGRFLPNAAYHAARLLSYTTVGLLLGFAGRAVAVESVRPWAMLVAGLYMLVLGLGMTGRAPWAARLQPRPPKFLVRALSRLRKGGAGRLATPLSFGLLTGLFPCAPLMAAEVAAAGSGSAAAGAVTMLGFGLGTIPLLLGFGLAASFIPASWRGRLSAVMAAVVMVMGLVFLDRAALLFGFPVSSATLFPSPAGTAWFAVMAASIAGIAFLSRSLGFLGRESLPAAAAPAKNAPEKGTSR